MPLTEEAAHVSSRGTPSHTDRLRRFLQAYWLRPENALWMTLRSQALETVPLGRRCADLSCGDGVFTFLHLGGQFEPEFDVFSCVNQLDQVHTDHADMFDHFDAAFAPPIAKAPQRGMAVGTDLKPAMLAKAERLCVYERLVECDNNKPLPFEEASFDTIYCNSAYWVRNIDGFLREVARTVSVSGNVILHVKFDNIRQFTLDRHRDVLGDRFLDIIGRGRFDTWPTVMSQAAWEKAFQRSGLRIVRRTPFALGTHAQIWDVGLRPLAPLLVRMTQSLDGATRREIKRDWVDLCIPLLEPLCTSTLHLQDGEPIPVEMQYVLARAVS